MAALAGACGNSATDAGPHPVVDGGILDVAAVDVAGPDAGPLRDWGQFPAIVEMDGVTELWVLSDVHGDYAAYTKLLAGGNVITQVPDGPSEVAWNQGSAVLVIVGDLIDKGPDAPDVIRLTMALATSAAAAGGRVIVTMGNHEAEFLADPENADAVKTGVEEGFDPELTAIGLSPAGTAAGDDDLGAFLRDLPLAARVDDWFFVHAGNTSGATLTALSGAIQSQLDASGFGAPILAADDSFLEARLNASPPQWWDATGDATTLLTQWTAALGVAHLVMGHQPGAVGITNGPDRAADAMVAEYGGLLFLIDTGLSVGADDTGGALLHAKKVGTAQVTWEEVLPDGSKKSL